MSFSSNLDDQRDFLKRPPMQMNATFTFLITKIVYLNLEVHYRIDH